MVNWLIVLNSLEAGRQGSWEGERPKAGRLGLNMPGNTLPSSISNWLL